MDASFIKERPITSATSLVVLAVIVWHYYSPAEPIELGIFRNGVEPNEATDKIISKLNEGVNDDNTFFRESESGDTCPATGGPHIIDVFAAFPQLCAAGCGEQVSS